MESENDVMNYVNQLQTELQQEQLRSRQLAGAQMAMYDSQSNAESSLVKWQLNLEEEKERIFHLLKGHRRVTDEKGQERWVEPLTNASVILNDYGVDYIMGLLESFLNRNIILSNWDEDRINEICLDLGNQINEDIYNDYERMGLDTDDKRKKFCIIILKVIINVEAALRRGMGGRENLNLRKIITVTQNETPQRNPEFPVVSNSRSRRRLMHPTTWFG